MNTLDILSALRNNLWQPIFYTVCAADELPKPVQIFYPLAIIVNTANRYETGVHWQAIWISDPGTRPEYFCSYASPVPVHIRSFLLELGYQSCLDKCFPIQQPTSTSCGLFAVDFLMFKSYGGSRSAYFQRFSNKNFAKNERVLRTLWGGDITDLRYMTRTTGTSSF